MRLLGGREPVVWLGTPEFAFECLVLVAEGDVAPEGVAKRDVGVPPFAAEDDDGDEVGSPGSCPKTQSFGIPTSLGCGRDRLRRPFSTS